MTAQQDPNQTLLRNIRKEKRDFLVKSGCLRAVYHCPASYRHPLSRVGTEMKNELDRRRRLLALWSLRQERRHPMARGEAGSHVPSRILGTEAHFLRSMWRN